MKKFKPTFELTRVYDDESQDAPEIVSLSESISEAQMSRRGFLGASLTAAAALALLDSCASRKVVTKSRPEDEDCGKTYAHSDDVTQLAISANGFFLASGSKDNTIKCWRLTDNALVQTFQTRYPNLIAINPFGTMIAYRNSESKIELRKLPSGKLIGTFSGNCFLFSFDGKLLFIGRDSGAIDCYRIDNDSTFSISAGNQPVEALASDFEGKYIATCFGSKIKEIRLLNKDGEIVKTLNVDISVNELAFTSDGKYLAAGNKGYSAILFRISDGQEVGRLKGNTGNNLIFSPKDELIFWGSMTDTSEAKFFKWREKPVPDALSMAFTPDGEQLITGGKNGSVKCWNWPDLGFITCLMDINCSGNRQRGLTYNYTDEFGQVISFTLPCGSPLPAGATCTCNCVPGKLENTCTCNKVCTCNSVCTCQAVNRVCTCNSVCTCQAVGTSRRVCTCVPVYR